MNTELTYLTYVTILTALLWMPYVLNTIMVRGLMDAVGYPEHARPLAGWATRLKSAHYNAVENLVVFAALVLVANSLELNGAATAASSMVYFWARVVHVGAYTFAIPFVRTLAFVVGFLSQMCIAWQIIAM